MDNTHNFKAFVSEAFDPDPVKAAFADLDHLYYLVMLCKEALVSAPCEYEWSAETDGIVKDTLKRFQQLANMQFDDVVTSLQNSDELLTTKVCDWFGTQPPKEGRHHGDYRSGPDLYIALEYSRPLYHKIDVSLRITCPRPNLYGLSGMGSGISSHIHELIALAERNFPDILKRKIFQGYNHMGAIKLISPMAGAKSGLVVAPVAYIKNALKTITESFGVYNELEKLSHEEINSPRLYTLMSSIGYAKLDILKLKMAMGAAVDVNEIDNQMMVDLI